MASLNKVFLMGNLTRQPDLRYTPGGAAVCEFGLVVNRKFVSNNQEREETCFVDITVWGKQGETAGRYLEKGSPVLVEGRLQLDQWQDKETGGNRSKLRVVAERVQFLGRAAGRDGYDGDNGDNGDYQQQGGSYSRGGAPQQQQRYDGGGAQSRPPSFNDNPPPMPDGAFNVDDEPEDDIPF